MRAPRPFRVETLVHAPPDAVRRALTEPGRIRQWFGWDHVGLDDEIRLTFVEQARRLGPDGIVLGDGQRVELRSDGSRRTVVRAVMPGSLDDAEWEDLYDDAEEGWRTFFEQLRFHLEFRPTGRRRTVRLSGTAAARRALAVIEAVEPKEVWHESRHQRMIVDRDGHLAVIASRLPLDEAGAAPLTVTVSTYGLRDAAFARVRREWAARWAEICAHPLG
jgi:uncharacterized protein YndB with AHSA1/START domain